MSVILSLMGFAPVCHLITGLAPTRGRCLQRVTFHFEPRCSGSLNYKNEIANKNVTAVVFPPILMSVQ